MSKRKQSEAQDPKPSPIKRACDACRARKIRCDKESPCSACKASKVTCHTSPRPTQTHRKRIHLTAEYETKLDQIHSRLEDLDNIIKGQGCRPTIGSMPIAAIPQSPASTVRETNISRDSSVLNPSTPIPILSETAEENNTFEGGTSMKAHSSYAQDMLQKAIDIVPLSANNPTMASALASLREMTTNRSQQIVQSLRTSDESIVDFRKLQLPPVGAVLDVLRRARESPVLLFSPMIEITPDRLTQLCKDVFFCVDPYPVSTAVLVHGHLYNLFHEYSITAHGQEKVEMCRIRDLCHRNFDASIANLTTLMQVSEASLMALLLGASDAVQTSKPSMAWRLTAAAATMAVSMGWHRRSSPGTTSNHHRLLKFWNIYVMDKSLSLRLGRAAILQDYDIDADLPDFGASEIERETTKVFTSWVHAGRIQGQVYERLYSPSALRSGPQLGDLLEQMQIQQQRLADIHIVDESPDAMTRNEASNLDRGLRMLIHGDRVSCSMMLTMIHRATGNHQECLAAARQGIDQHLIAARECEELGDFFWDVYLHWTILHVPCIAYIIVFCNILATSNLEDLNRLENFTETLSKGETEGLKKFHVLCRTFCQIAQLYVQARQTAGATPDFPELSFGMAELNAFSSTLDMNTMMSSDLGDWFTGHQHLMDLLDDTSYLGV